MQRQIKREIEIVSRFKTCPRNSQFDPINIDSLEELRALEQFSTFSFFEASVMETLFCAFDTNITVANPKDYTANPKVLQFFNRLRQIGADSEEGFALFAGFKSIQDLFVIKVPRNIENDNLFHEYFVGVACLNKMRRFVPNFSYVFGAFKCLPPDIAPNKQVGRWCNNVGKGSVNYVIFEKIDGPSMDSVAQQIAEGEVDFLQFLSYLLQLLFALRLAWATCRFTHYDLHDENVIIRKIPNVEELYIPYINNPNDKNSQSIYIRSDGIATIIDYGRCHVKVTVDKTPEHFGFYGHEDVGLFHDRSRPLHDVFKIIGFTSFHVARQPFSRFREAFLEQVYPLFSSWPHINSQSQPTNVNGFREMLSRERNNFFEMGKNISEVEKKPDPIASVIDFIQRQYPEEWNQIVFRENQISQGALVLDCKNITCHSKAGVKSELTEN